MLYLTSRVRDTHQEVMKVESGWKRERREEGEGREGDRSEEEERMRVEEGEDGGAAVERVGSKELHGGIDGGEGKSLGDEMESVTRGKSAHSPTIVEGGKEGEGEGGGGERLEECGEMEEESSRECVSETDSDSEWRAASDHLPGLRTLPELLSELHLLRRTLSQQSSQRKRQLESLPTQTEPRPHLASPPLPPMVISRQRQDGVAGVRGELLPEMKRRQRRRRKHTAPDYQGETEEEEEERKGAHVVATEHSSSPHSNRTVTSRKTSARGKRTAGSGWNAAQCTDSEMPGSEDSCTIVRVERRPLSGYGSASNRRSGGLLSPPHVIVLSSTEETMEVEGSGKEREETMEDIYQDGNQTVDSGINSTMDSLLTSTPPRATPTATPMATPTSRDAYHTEAVHSFGASTSNSSHYTSSKDQEMIHRHSETGEDCRDAPREGISLSADIGRGSEHCSPVSQFSPVVGSGGVVGVGVAKGRERVVEDVGSDEGIVMEEEEGSWSEDGSVIVVGCEGGREVTEETLVSALRQEVRRNPVALGWSGEKMMRRLQRVFGPVAREW